MSDTANGFTSITGTNPVFLTIGPLASGLVLATVKLITNMQLAAVVTIGVVLSKNASAAADNFAAGNSILERSNEVSGGKPSITFNLADSTLHEFIMSPTIRLATRPLFVTLRLVHDQNLGVGRYYCEVVTLDRAEVDIIEGLGRIIQTVGKPGRPISADADPSA